MFRIGEFSRLGQVSVSMLRHYDALGLLTPGHTDPSTGYRSYTIDQLPRLHRIIALNSLGITLEQIAGLLQSKHAADEQHLRDLLAQRRERLAEELRTRQFQLRSLDARLQQLSGTTLAEVALRSLEPLQIVGVRTRIAELATMDGACAALYRQLYNALARHGVTGCAEELTLYHSEEYVEQDLDTEACVVLDAPSGALLAGKDGLHVRWLPAVPQAATLIFAGCFGEVSAAVLTLLSWVAARGLSPAGPLRELHHSGPAHPAGADRVSPAVIELQLPVQ